MKNIEIKNVILGNGIPKVCIPIMEKNIEDIVSVKEKLKKEEFDLVEIRIDYFEDIFDEEKLLSFLEKIKNLFSEKIIIFTLRTKEEGGKIELTAKEYEEINELVIKSSFVDMIDLQLLIDENLVKNLVLKAHERNKKVILSMHNFNKTPKEEEILKYASKMEELDGDIKKFALMPTEMKDVIKTLEISYKVREKYSKPVIFISMGKLGGISRILGESFGSSITFGTLEENSLLGQVSVTKLNEVLKVIHEIVK